MSLEKRPEDILEKNLPERRRTPGVVSDPDTGVTVPIGKPLEEAEASTEEETNEDRSDA